MLEIPTPVFLVIMFGKLAVGFLFGMFYERTRWNSLIQKGFIRKPNKKP
jgi:hypothetical protein